MEANQGLVRNSLLKMVHVILVGDDCILVGGVDPSYNSSSYLGMSQNSLHFLLKIDLLIDQFGWI